MTCCTPAWRCVYHAHMQGSAAESYAQLVRDRIAGIEGPVEFRDPDILIAPGHAVTVTPATAARPCPVLTVGDRVAVEGSRELVQGLVALELAHAYRLGPAQRRAKQAGSWAPMLSMISMFVMFLGMRSHAIGMVFVCGLALTAGIAGLRLRLRGVEAARSNIYSADEVAAGWVGRRAVVDALHWHHGHTSPPTSFLPPFALPSFRQRLTRIGG